MNNKLQSINNIKQSGIVSLAISVLFAIYNFYLGFANNYGFGWSIAFYYLLLSCARLLLLKYPKQKNLTDNKTAENVTKNTIRINFFRRSVATSILLAVINLLLIAPITLMVLQQRQFNLGQIPAITIAAYTTYKVTVAVIHYTKSRKNTDCYETTLRAVNMTDALVSVLTLQNTLIATNPSTDADGIRTLTIFTSGGIYLVIVFISIFCLRRLSVMKKNTDGERE